MSPTNYVLSSSALQIAALLLLSFSASAQRVIDFSDLPLSPESYDNDSGGFSSGGAVFNNYYDSGFWGGWSYSNVSDAVTPGWGNQFSAIPGTGLGESGVYGVGYVDTFTPALPRIVLPEGETILGVHVTNTTYAYYAMRDGDDFSVKFGGLSGDEPDFFLLTVTGFTANETLTGSVDFHLADFRFEDNSLDYIVDVWSWIDLSGLGAETRILQFTLDSSDAGIWGINTPAYLALGGVTVVPEPATIALWGGIVVGIVVLGGRIRRTKADVKT